MDAPFPEGMLEDIAAFLADDAGRPSGQDVPAGLFETALFFPLQRQAEMAAMMRTARSVGPRVVMEIGADKGGGLYAWLKCLPTVEVAVACELRGTPYWRLFHDAFPRVEFLWLGGASSYDPATVERVRRWLGKQAIDVLFIDGDKGAMLRDFTSYLPVMSPHGVAFMHDINDGAASGPRRDFEWVKCDGFRCEEIIDTSDSARALARQKEGLPPANAHEGWLRHWGGKSAGVGVVHIDGRNAG